MNEKEHPTNSYNSSVESDFSTLKEYDQTYKTQLTKLDDQMYRISRIPGKKIFPVKTPVISLFSKQSDGEYKKLQKD